MNTKPILLNGYKINSEIEISIRIFSNSNLEIYQLENGKFLNLIKNELNISGAKKAKFDIFNLNLGKKSFLAFISNENLQSNIKEIYEKLTNLSGFEAVAGMEELKENLMRDVIIPIQQKKKYAKFKLSIPNGILLYGPLGCGKTFIVKKLAEELDFSFFEIKHSDVTSPYIHGGVGKIADVFNSAKIKAPAIIFIDELDGLLPERSKLDGNQDYKLEEINEFLMHLNNAGKNDILVVGATNQIDLIDQAVLRSGRFDKKFYVMSPDFEARIHLFEMYLCERPLKDINYDILAKNTENYSYSDIEYICNEAARVAVLKRLDFIEKEVIISNTKLSIENKIEIIKK